MVDVRDEKERLACKYDAETGLIEMLYKGYRASTRLAVEYMGWFEPAWATLTDTEQTVLREFYMNGSLRSGAAARLQERLSYGHSQIDRIRSKALARLSHLLFGK